MQVQVLSWNIWIECDFSALTEYVDSRNADIIGMQEVKDTDEERDIIGYLQERDYQCVHVPTEKEGGDGIYRHGPAIFSRYPIVDTDTFYVDADEKRAAVRADIDVDGTTLHVFSVHLTHTHQQYSDAQVQEAQRLTQHLPRERTIVLGDFNAEPDSETIAAMKRELCDANSSNTPTWSVYPEGCPVCLPDTVYTTLDYIFTSNDLTASAVQVDRSEASDHLPVVATITF